MLRGVDPAGSVSAAMVRIAPNGAHLRGTVESVNDTGDPSGFLEVAIRVADIAAIPKTRNMFDQQPGEVVNVLISPAMVTRLDLRAGVEVDADVRRADLHRSFVHPERIRVASGGEQISGAGRPDPDASALGSSGDDHRADDSAADDRPDRSGTERR